ncbi:hypothetical protein SAMN05216597_3869 [Pseudomonas cannabina]|nr:hypothetical protein SAMN05216597_3869 [Pseudomonas cannabina]
MRKIELKRIIRDCGRAEGEWQLASVGRLRTDSRVSGGYDGCDGLRSGPETCCLGWGRCTVFTGFAAGSRQFADKSALTLTFADKRSVARHAPTQAKREMRARAGEISALHRPAFDSGRRPWERTCSRRRTFRRYIFENVLTLSRTSEASPGPLPHKRSVKCAFALERSALCTGLLWILAEGRGSELVREGGRLDDIFLRTY